MEHLCTLLREHNLKATSQRLSILEMIERYGHIDIESLFEKLHATFPTLALATLYRNINDLVQKGIVSEVKLPHQKQKYEITKDEHAHLLCDTCGMIEDATIDTSSLSEQIKNQYGYDVQSCTIVLNFTCPHCRGA